MWLMMGCCHDPMRRWQASFAGSCGIDRSRLEQLSAEKKRVSGDTALRLGRVLGTGPELWMNLQARFDIELAKATIGEALDKLAPIEKAA